MNQLGIVRAATPVGDGLTVLRLSCAYNLASIIEPCQVELQGGLGLEGGPLLHQLMAYEHDLLLQVEEANIDLSGGFKQSYRDVAG